MFFYNKIIIVATLTFLIKVAADDSYIPCKSFISFSYDDSVTLNAAQFKTQMNFIKNIIGNISHPERLRVESGYTGEFNWNSGFSIAQMQSLIISAQHTSNPYSLTQQVASLLTSVEALNTVTDPIGAIIFISDTSDSALKNADRWFAKLQNVEITFVLLGTNVNSLKLQNFTKNFIYWPDLSLPEPDNWDLISYHSFGCSKTSSTLTSSVYTISGNTSMPTLTPLGPTSAITSSTSMPFIPCNSWIHFGIDDSNVLDSQSYQKQLNFISSAIGNITYPERIEAVGAYEQPVPWNSGLNIAQIQNVITQVPQEGPYRLRNQFAVLWLGVDSININKIPVGALIFISDTSDAALAGADQFLDQLSNIRITFVMLGSNTDSSKLTKYSSNFIYWTDLTKPQPDNWDNSSSAAYGC